MKMRKAALIFVLAAILLLTACSGAHESAPAPKSEPSPETGANITPGPVQSDPEAPEETPASDASDPDELEAMRDAYERALNKFYYEKILPDGVSVDEGMDVGMDTDFFAVCDIDFDGRDELVIQHNSASMAGMTEVIYGYDSESGQLREELSQFPMLTWFDNGAVIAWFSHNQGLAGRFWPYFLYVYNSDRDCYDYVAMVDAWDRNLLERDFDGTPFPDEVDVSGEGIVYYIIETEEYVLGDPVDTKEYERWIDGYTAGAETFELPLVPLDPENFRRGVLGTEGF